MHVVEALSFPWTALSYEARQKKKKKLKVQIALSGLDIVCISVR